MAARTFRLERDEDITGVSGTGTVAEGVVFSDGETVIRWIVGEDRSTVVGYSNGLASVEKIHGHNGSTRIVFDE